MERKNTILLTVIALATLLISVVGATFAYFASNINVKDGDVNVNVNTSNKQSIFLSSAEGNLDLNIASYMMQEHDATTNAENGDTTNNEDIITSLTNNANIEVTLNANDTGGLVKCTYDLIFAWDENSSIFNDYTDASVEKEGIHLSKYYVRSEYKKNEEDSVTSSLTDNFREITLGGTMSVTPPASDPSSTNIFNEGEKNIDELECVESTTEDENEKCKVLYIRQGESISTESEAKTNYHFEIKFYNLPTDQSSLMDKHFKGQIKVANVKC